MNFRDNKGGEKKAYIPADNNGKSDRMNKKGTLSFENFGELQGILVLVISYKV